MPTGSVRRPCTDVLWRSARIRSLWTCFYVSISDATWPFHWLKEARVARCYHPFSSGNEYPSCSTGYREGPVFSFINSDGTRQAPIFSSQVKIDFILAIRGPKGIFGARGGWERLSWYLTGPTSEIWADLTTASSEWFNQVFRFVFLLNSLRTV